MSPITFDLSTAWNDASSWARVRREESRRLGIVESAGAPVTGGLYRDRLGVLGEWAVAVHYLALSTWTPTVNNFTGADITLLTSADEPLLIDVRARGLSTYDLLIRPKDPGGRRNVHVTLTSAGSHRMTVWGWAWTSEAKRPQWLQSYGGRPPAYFVPASALRPLATLLEVRV